MAQGERAARVAEQIQREAARIFLEKADDPVLRAATVTAVRVSADLRHARILFTVAVELREEAERRARRFEPLLQRELARRVRLRYVPEIALRFDEGFEHALRLEKIFEEIGAGREKDDAPDTPDPNRGLEPAATITAEPHPEGRGSVVEGGPGDPEDGDEEHEDD